MKPKGESGWVEAARPVLRAALWIALGLLFFTGQKLSAQTPTYYPSWWANYGVLSGTASPQDFSAATEGQAKNIALEAVYELDNDLAQFGGAGPTLDNLAATLLASTTNSLINEFSGINNGQLKHLAQPFYDRLLALGYNGPPLTSGTYPWVGSGRGASDFAMANNGEVKYLWSFDVTRSTFPSADGIPDWWVDEYYPGLISSGTDVNPNAYVAWSGSQVTILQAYQQGLNPDDFYNGQMPGLSIVSGSGQIGTSGSFVSSPLVVQVTDTNGNPLYGAPVAFAVTSGGGQVQVSSTGSPTNSQTILADSNGMAQIFFELPPTLSNTSQITATAGSGTSAVVTFSECSDDGTGTYSSPFVPTNVIGTIDTDGTEAITWQNNDASSPIYVYQLTGSTWTVSGTLPVGTTYYSTSESNAGFVEIGNNYSPGGSTGTTVGGSGNGPGSWPFVPIPVSSYAAMDVSGSASYSGTNSISVDGDSMVMDDSNNVAFTITSTNGEAEYIWPSTTGSPSLTQNLVSYTVVTPSASSTETDSYTVGPIVPDGTAYGTHTYSLITASGSSAEWGVVSKIINGTFNDVAPPPNPPFGPAIPPLGDVSGTSGPFASPPIRANEGGFWASVSGVLSDGSGVSGSYVACNGTAAFYYYPLRAPAIVPEVSGGPPQVYYSSFSPDQMSTSGAAIGDAGDAGYWGPEIWTGTSLLAPSPLSFQVGINDLAQVIGWSGTNACLWSNGTVYTMAQLVPAQYQHEVSEFDPLLISGTDSNGSVKIFAAGICWSDANGDGTWQNLMLTLTNAANPAVASGSNANTLQVVHFAANVEFGNGEDDGPDGPILLNAQGILAGPGSLVGLPYLGAPVKPLVLPQVRFTGTDANPFVDTGAASGTASGFDGYTNPNWLMVPENSSNSAKAYTLASPSFTAAFTGTTSDPYMWMTVSPSTSNTSPQTTTANVGYTSGTYLSEIAFGIPGSVATGGELHVDVKQYQLKTIAIHEIIEQSGTNPPIFASTAPTAAALQSYLNQVYGLQTNTYFYVDRQDYTINYDVNGIVNVTDPLFGGPQVAAIRAAAQNPSFDFNLYYVNSLYGPGDSRGFSFRRLHDAVIGSNSGSFTNLISAHELGHLFGLLHPEEIHSGSQYDPTAPPYDLMHHVVSGEFLDHLQWEIINPYNPRRL